VLLGFAPKWLWTSEKERSEGLRFRLVCTDPRFAGRAPTPLKSYRPLPGESSRDAVLAAALQDLEASPSPRSDRACWQLEAESLGLERLCNEVWERTEVVYLDSLPLLDDPAGPLFRAEREALSLLIRMLAVNATRQRQALAALRTLLHSNAVEFDPVGTLPIPRVDRDPRVVEYDDIHYTLFEFQAPPEEPVPFQIVTRAFLEEAAAEPKRVFVARRPRWGDVVHGEDKEVRFLEREMTDRLVARVGKELLKGLGAEQPLPVLLVLGAPGAGKSTLVLRVAARLVKDGLAVVAAPKLNLDRIEEDEVEPYLRALARLEDGPLPVLLVLDDPLFADSGWDVLLRRLAKRSRRVAVLGASPEFLFREFGYTLTAGRQIAFASVVLPRPLQTERRILAQLHGRDAESFEEREEEFLVLAMEASAGISFDTIIDRIWNTLNHGHPIDPRRRPADLPWPVRAYLLACCFHRLYLRCSEVLMRAVLSHTGEDQPPDGFAYDLQRLDNEQGWSIFSIERLTDWQRFLGSQIGTAHARIASEAWRRRPVPAFDISDWVLACSVDAQPAASEIGRLAVRLEQESGNSDAGFLSRLTTLWNRAATDGVVESRDLYLLHSALLAEGDNSSARRVRPGLEACLARRDEQSWLAFMALTRDTGSREAAIESLGTSGDLVRLIQVADLHLAPFRAGQFLELMEGEPVYEATVIGRIIETCRHPQAYKLLAHILKSHSGDAAIRNAALEWIRENPGHPHAYLLLKYFVISHATDEIVRHQVFEWVKDNQSHYQAFFLLKAVIVANANDQAVQRSALEYIRGLTHPSAYTLLKTFVKACPNDSILWQTVLGMVRDCPNQPSMRRLLEPIVHANLADKTFRHSLGRWIRDNPGHPQEYWFRVCLGEGNLGSEASFYNLLDWIRDNPEHPKVHRLLKPFVEAEAEAQPLRESLMEWVSDNPGYTQAPKLLKPFLSAPEADTFRALVLEWIRTNVGHPDAYDLLAALIRAGKGSEEVRRYVRERIVENPDHPLNYLIVAALVEFCNGSEDVLRLGEERALNPRQFGRSAIVVALLRGGKAAPRYIELAVDNLKQVGKGGRTFLLSRLAEALAENQATSLAYLVSDESRERRGSILKSIAVGFRRHSEALGGLLRDWIGTLRTDDANELIVQLFDVGINPDWLPAFVAERLAQNFRRRGYGFLVRAARRNAAARSALLEYPALDPRVRVDLLTDERE